MVFFRPAGGLALTRLAKITSKNQITIPKKIMDQIPETRYFEVELRDGAVILKPLRT